MSASLDAFAPPAEADLTTALISLAETVEAVRPGLLASVQVLRDGRLWQVAGPSLPAAYTAAIDGHPIGPSVGSCGTAAHCGHLIVVVDIATSPLWASFRDIALQHGLRSCWSEPILGIDGRVLGTFALYERQPSAPTSEDRALITKAGEVARRLLEGLPPGAHRQ